MSGTRADCSLSCRLDSLCAWRIIYLAELQVVDDSSQVWWRPIYHLTQQNSTCTLLFSNAVILFKKLPSCVQYITLTIESIIAVHHLKHPQGWLIIVCGEEKIHFIQTDTHCCFWDRMTHWLYNSITLPCFCAFHALKSQGNHWAGAEGTPYYQAAQSAGKCYTATLNKEKKKKTGTGGCRSPQRERESSMRTVRCRLQQNSLRTIFKVAAFAGGNSQYFLKCTHWHRKLYLQWWALSGLMLQHLGHL